MGKRILLVGLGMQGKAALYDLIEHGGEIRITVADCEPGLQEYLSRYPAERVSARAIDARDEASLSSCMREADVVVEALPGEFALPLGRLAAEIGVNLVSSMYYLDPGEEDAQKIRSMQQQILKIGQNAREKGVTILTEFGLDPGLDLILGARAISEMDEVREFRTYGAGLPDADARANPLRYKFSWSPIGVMKSYRRPARIIAKGRPLTIEATRMFEPENYHLLEVKEIGAALECFPNGDSVHYAELFGIRDSVREMGRYTCRLPGHCAFWDILVKCGFLDRGSISLGEISVSPIEFTASLLASQKQFFYSEDEKDMTFLRIDARGKRNRKSSRVVYQLIDKRDLKTGFTSMQRTVGFTLSLGARLILEGRLKKPGLLTPLDVPYESVFPDLEERNIRVVRQQF